MGEKGREGGTRGGTEEAMILGRERASVEEGMVKRRGVEEGNGLGRDGTKQGERGGRKQTDEEVGRERRSEGDEQGSVAGRGMGVRERGTLQGRYPEEGTGQYTVYSAQNNPQCSPCP